MFGMIAGGLVALIEKELISHSSDIQDLVIKQLEEVAKHLFLFVSSKKTFDHTLKDADNG